MLTYLPRLILALTAALAFAISSPGVGLSAANEQATLYGPVYAPGCSSVPPSDVGGAATAGSVNFHVQDGLVVLKDHLKGAEPNTTYQVQLWSGTSDGSCTEQTLGTITTNSNGVGHGIFTAHLFGPAFSVSNQSATAVFSTADQVAA